MFSSGSISGASFSGSAAQTRTLVIRVPLSETQALAFAPTVASGGSVAVPLVQSIAQAFAPEIKFIVDIQVPTAETVARVYTPVISSGVSVFVPTAESIAQGFAPELVLIVNGIPDWDPARDGTTIDITVTNREGKTVAVWQAENSNSNGLWSNFELVDTYDSDAIELTGLTLSKNYKLKLQFVSEISGSIVARGIHSGSKYAKHGSS